MYINNGVNYLRVLKNKNIFIFGCGRLGDRTLGRLKKCGFNVIGFIDNNNEKIGTKHRGIAVIGLEQFDKNDKNNFIVVAVAAAGEIQQQLIDRDIFNYVLASQIDFGGGEEYYDEAYFAEQKRMGEFGGQDKLKVFSKYIKEDMTVVEFGCGGGYLLDRICAKEKMGIEINDEARKQAESLGVKTVKTIEEIPDGYADVIISTHALEHTENPLACVKGLRNKLKEGGKAVFQVPNESCETEYQRSDWNNHLYTWNCLNLGNLFKAAGYFVYSVERIQEQWPNRYEKLYDMFGDDLFSELQEICGKVYDSNQCLIVAYK